MCMLESSEREGFGAESPRRELSKGRVMKVLITGANGHIGANVVRSCIQAGMEPVAFIRESSA